LHKITAVIRRLNCVHRWDSFLRARRLEQQKSNNCAVNPLHHLPHAPAPSQWPQKKHEMGLRTADTVHGDKD